MSERPNVFVLFLPGIVGGVILAAIAPLIGDAAFHNAFERLFPHSRGDEEKSRQHFPANDSKDKNGLPSGGTNAL